DNINVLIKKLWIEKKINLTSKPILEHIRKIPEDDEDFVIKESFIDDDNIINTKRSVFDYNVEDLVDKYTL
ncbi:9159_t:CDS:1, partial [Racocetra persica]